MVFLIYPFGKSILNGAIKVNNPISSLKMALGSISPRENYDPVILTAKFGMVKWMNLTKGIYRNYIFTK